MKAFALTSVAILRLRVNGGGGGAGNADRPHNRSLFLAGMPMNAPTRIDTARVIHPPRGPELNCKNWLIESPYRMIQWAKSLAKHIESIESRKGQVLQSCISDYRDDLFA